MILVLVVYTSINDIIMTLQKLNMYYIINKDDRSLYRLLLQMKIWISV